MNPDNNSVQGDDCRAIADSAGSVSVRDPAFTKRDLIVLPEPNHTTRNAAKAMTTVLTYGTFDLFHVGHVRLLQRLSKLGDRIVVACSTDEFNSVKGKKTIVPYAHRKETLEACRYVDKVIPEENWEQKRRDVVNERADIFAMGDDWAGRFDDLADIVQVVYLPRTEKISTTDLRRFVSAIEEEKVHALAETVKRLADQIRML